MLTQAESWGAVDRIAASLGVRADTRRKWRERGRVPGRWHLPIVEKARSEGLELDPAALSDFRPSTRVRAEPSRRGHHTRIEPGGRVTIPEPLLEKLDLEVGDVVILEEGGGELRLRSLGRAIADIQALVRGYVPEDVSLADELIAERRREAERE
jgi:bifunctional DNA-binding transcriptional regulator/antitoxin component of YhaV-PrlF toxin-antitoxin module